ncbi:MAG: thioredoxin family protein [Firmicutes bacterium]|nr:thioredoxin family protein [Bacillota bacterium]
MEVLDISMYSFKEKILRSKGLVILSLYAKWYKPSKEQIDILKEISKEFDSISIYKIDYNSSKEIKDVLEIVSIPTLIFFKNGKEEFRITGSQTKKQIKLIISALKD